jgi:hypothetical protein
LKRLVILIKLIFF